MNVINDDVQYITHSILELRHLKGFAGWNEWELKQEHRLAGADRSSIFFLKVKGLSFSITKEGGVE
ncbi:hypothetical protein DPMN_118463 [Dreissena polymorpha]|uniref:Uncharacterized protein n=1 Tax=Dreissena polymorpha TaxID=45954 RepID=A0A9D4GHG3_DREPO|nr:hypothetical protein DPMN_118463 [Dreissena polymorpha]